MDGRIASLDRMLAAWNASPEEVRGHLDAALSPDVEFVDPSVVTLGIDEFQANVHAVHERAAGATFHRASGVDAHHDLVRYAWEIRAGDQVVMTGADVVEFDEHDRVRRVLGFFGPLPTDYGDPRG